MVMKGMAWDTFDIAWGVGVDPEELFAFLVDEFSLLDEQDEVEISQKSSNEGNEAIFSVMAGLVGKLGQKSIIEFVLHQEVELLLGQLVWISGKVVHY